MQRVTPRPPEPPLRSFAQKQTSALLAWLLILAFVVAGFSLAYWKLA